MRKKRIIIGFILFLILAFVGSYPIIINNLIVDEDPVQSDVIIVPEGQSLVRAYRASELLHNGFSDSGKIIVSPINEAYIPGYQSFRIKQEQVIPETKATSTYENAVNTLRVMKENGFDSAIVVSSDFHMLRTKLIYERINQDYDFKLTYVAAYHLVEDELVPWYEAGSHMKRAANREFWKYWGYLFGLYHFFNL